MNQVSLVGRLVRDVEVKYTSNTQTAVVENTLAVDKPKKADGADFIRIKVFGKQAEAMERYCKKGALLGILGRIEVSSYQDRETGKTVYKTEVLASNVEFLSWEHTTGDNNKRAESRAPEERPQERQESFAAIDSAFPF